MGLSIQTHSVAFVKDQHKREANFYECLYLQKPQREECRRLNSKARKRAQATLGAIERYSEPTNSKTSSAVHLLRSSGTSDSSEAVAAAAAAAPVALAAADAPAVAAAVAEAAAVADWSALLLSLRTL